MLNNQSAGDFFDRLCSAQSRDCIVGDQTFGCHFHECRLISLEPKKYDKNISSTP